MKRQTKRGVEFGSALSSGPGSADERRWTASEHSALIVLQLCRTLIAHDAQNRHEVGSTFVHMIWHVGWQLWHTSQMTIQMQLWIRWIVSMTLQTLHTHILKNNNDI